MTETLCCCNSGNKRYTCCGPYLSDQSISATPEQLMRSRYAAFFHKNIDYLIATRDPDHREENDRQGTGQRHDKIHGQIHENSRFVNENGRWYYCDGQMLPPVVWGRNQPCWCHSNKKYKKCHGAP